MKKIAALPLATLFFFLWVAPAFPQETGAPPSPGPEHARLTYFVGKWVSEGEIKPSPYGPGGKYTSTDTCDWYAGRFAVVCNSEVVMGGATIKGLSIMSYEPAEKTYIYFETNSMGENAVSRGTVDGDTWTWVGENKMNGQTIHSRFTLKRVSNDVASFKFEMAAGSAPVLVVMEGKQTRQK